ncbi:MAG: TonB-dependent receptor, partial [Pseudomonadota bacterium]|nr:TonB-dependent receptor [Pseudomonadota bacterium]
GYNPNAGGPAANPQGIVFNDNNPNVTKQQAIFGEGAYKFNSSWKLTAGLRFFKFDVSNISNQRGLGTGTANATPSIGSASGSGSGVLPKVNLSYTPTGDLTVYATLSKGARPGGVNLPIPLPTPAQLAANPAQYDCGPGTPTVPPAGPVFLYTQPAYYGPDSIWSAELGEKARFYDRRFTVNADVFYVRWSHIQQYITLSCGYPYNANAGDAKSYGPELELSAKLVDGLAVEFSGAYTKAYISAPTVVSIAPGTRILNVPKYTGSLALNYDRALNGDLRATARLADSYVGPVDDQAYYRETLPGYNILDLRFGIVKNNWSAYLFGTNLADKHAALTINNTTFAWQQPTITRVSTNQPRTVGLEVMTKF